MEIVIPEPFSRRLRKKAPELQQKVVECVERLGDDPRHPGLHTHKIKGQGKKAAVFEAYVDRGNRVTFHYGESGEIVMRAHCNHDVVLANP